ncbi:hypothetical protein PTSG_01212 [Salpingoeca rosetta]|uniref:Uncharacterized protein n=1 Tax=Salpingoeca rosetta (strain ATCC 50818 / BSB-021) TaxID=946362 RepID=F2U150_SALR5|nr:uncharacterized protein PTSG_01212 [Salpingoeca rosetta]EGD80624.1 hypothetical protein PTSG_01212 [Salpingoeca rosetta]|eukprot:XP_004997185.1 hypothetical protein PTSG_01212 [Salpingoeca rosetta]
MNARVFVAVLTVLLSCSTAGVLAEICNLNRPVECASFQFSCPTSSHHHHEDYCCRTGSFSSNPNGCDNDCCDYFLSGHIIGAIVGTIFFVLIVSAIMYCCYAGVLCFAGRDARDGNATVITTTTTSPPVASSSQPPPYSQYPQASPPQGYPPQGYPAQGYPQQQQQQGYYPQQQQSYPPQQQQQEQNLAYPPQQQQPYDKPY